MSLTYMFERQFCPAGIKPHSSESHPWTLFVEDFSFLLNFASHSSASNLPCPLLEKLPNHDRDISWEASDKNLPVNSQIVSTITKEIQAISIKFLSHWRFIFSFFNIPIHFLINSSCRAMCSFHSWFSRSFVVLEIFWLS